MSKIDSRLEALHQAGIHFQLRNVPGGNDYDFGYFFLTKMCICTRKTAVLNALNFFSFEICSPLKVWRLEQSTVQSTVVKPATGPATRNVNKDTNVKWKAVRQKCMLLYHIGLYGRRRPCWTKLEFETVMTETQSQNLRLLWFFMWQRKDNTKSSNY